MNSFDPNQSLLPSVGGSITPMSGGGKQGDGYVLLEAKKADYTDNESMRASLSKMAPGYFKNTDIQKDIDKLFENGGTFEANELAIKKEVLNYVATLPSKTVNRFIEPEKKGSIENTPESQLKLMTYIASCKIDVDKMKITLNANELVISYTIPGPTGASVGPTGTTETSNSTGTSVGPTGTTGTTGTSAKNSTGPTGS